MTPGPAIPPAMRAVLVDRAASPRASGAEAHSSALFHAHALREISRALNRAGLDALLVKGAALALTVYADPAARPMGDIDLLVRPREGESERVVAALVASGCTLRPEPGRDFSAPLMGETALYLHAGAMTELVEVHTSLSKMVTRPMDGLFERALAARACPAS